MIECTIFGGVILDKYLEMEKYPERGQDGLITKDFDIAGGCSINMAATFNNLGGNAHVVSYIGTDTTGHEIKDYMDKHGFSRKYMKQIEGDTGYTLVILEKSGERTFITKKGVECIFNSELLRDDIVNIKNVMVTGYFLLSDHVHKIMACLEEIHKNCDHFLFDPGPLIDEIDPDIVKKILSLADIITVNEVEAESMELPEDPSKIIVIKKGKTGGEVICGSVRFDYHAKEVEAVDTTGAGDSFAAGLMFGLLSGMELKSSVSLAVECSARTVTLKGPHGFWKIEMEKNL
ncbi:MAG: carbohydrate kinase family protein, partial [Bacillota bacterium]